MDSQIPDKGRSLYLHPIPAPAIQELLGNRSSHPIKVSLNTELGGFEAFASDTSVNISGKISLSSRF
jgi:hypothetical protein